jgi:hypothetical protein
VLAIRAATRPGLAPDQRWRTLDLARSIDLAPRLAACLMLTVGGILTEYVGIGHPWWQMAGIVALGPLWLLLVITAFAAGGRPAGDLASRLEAGLRGLLMVAVPFSVAWSWFSGRLAPAPYVAAKLLLFALVLALGLRVRAAWWDVAAGRHAGVDAALDATASAAASRLAGVLPLVAATWLALAGAAWLGVTRPGESPPAATASAVSDPALSPR